MKKLPLIAAFGLIYSSSMVNAATIYDNKGLTYTIKGDIQVQLLKKHGKDKDVDVNYDDAELKNTISYDIGNGNKAFAQVDYDFKKEKSEETYVGLKLGNTKIWMGDTDYVTDAFGIEKNIDVVDIDGDSFAQDGGDDLIGLEFKAGSATIAFSHDIQVGDEDLKDDDDNVIGTASEESSLDIFVSVPLGPVDLGLAYQDHEAEGIATDTFGVSGEVKVAGINLGLAFSSSDSDSSKLDKDNISLAVTFPVASTTKASVGYDIVDYTSDSITDIDTWYANVVYKFPTAKKVSAFAEIANTDEDDSDVGYLLGMRVKF
ncbi:MAG: porin [Arenicella sp.]